MGRVYGRILRARKRADRVFGDVLTGLSDRELVQLLYAEFQDQGRAAFEAAMRATGGTEERIAQDAELLFGEEKPKW